MPEQEMKILVKSADIHLYFWDVLPRTCMFNLFFFIFKVNEQTRFYILLYIISTIME